MAIGGQDLITCTTAQLYDKCLHHNIIQRRI